MSNVIHHHAAKVLIGTELMRFVPKEDEPTVVMPLLLCRIITVNGEIWEHKFMAFGLTEGKIATHWDQHYNKTWKKVELNEK